MTDLPLRRLILYKHGVGYFERRGSVEGTSIALKFSRAAMDDVLKSLVVIELGEGGRQPSIDYERPESWSGRRLELGAGRTLRDMLYELRGHRVRLTLTDESTVDGLIMGLDEPTDDDSLGAGLVTVFRADVAQVVINPLKAIRAIQLLDTASDELAWSLRSGAEVGEDRRATIQLGPGKHDLMVAYLAPAPSWRVSYRLLVEKIQEETPDLLLQGWGLIDNVLDEDLTDVRLTLIAGRPVSFRYALYEPQQPERPMLQDEISPPALPPGMPAPPSPRRAKMAAMPAPMMAAGMAMEESMADFSLQSFAEAAPAAAEGAAQGALFRYDVREPISVGRGRSALVPLLNFRTTCRRDLVYRGRAGERHPMVTVRFDNSSGLVLERGPVTIIEQRSYGGESVVSWTAEGGEVTIRYAHALEITVREDTSTDQWTRRLRLGRDLLIHEIEESFNTIYLLRNSSAEERIVTIHHPRLTTHELFDTSPPEELTTELAVWKIPVPARGESALRVRERRLVERSESIRSISLETLRRYLNDRMLDQTTVSELREVLKLYSRLDFFQQRYKELAQERAKIHEQQAQIRGNLDVLRPEGEEGELRTRYIATLTETEDTLKALRAEEEALRAEEVQCREELETHLRSFGNR